MKAIKVCLDMYFYYFELLREPWENTKYLNSNEKGLFEQSDEPNLNSKAIFEQSPTEKEKYICVKIYDKVKIF